MDKALEFLISTWGWPVLIPLAAAIAAKAHSTRRAAAFDRARALQAIVCLNHEPPIRARVYVHRGQRPRYVCIPCDILRRKAVFQRAK